MSVQLGINPLTWTNDDLPSLGAETSLETCLSEGKEAGFAGFELGNKFPREARLLGHVFMPVLAAGDGVDDEQMFHSSIPALSTK